MIINNASWKKMTHYHDIKEKKNRMKNMSSITYSDFNYQAHRDDFAKSLVISECNSENKRLFSSVYLFSYPLLSRVWYIMCASNKC